MKIAITGHRPKNIYGYDLNQPSYGLLRSAIRDALLKNDCTDFYTGMDVGIDQLAALAVLDLKTEGHDIKLHAAIPCRDYSAKWPKASQDLYDTILSECDTKKLVTDGPYSLRVWQDRYIWMVRQVDMMIAVYNPGRMGATRDHVEFAKSCGKAVWCIPPLAIDCARWL